MSSAENLRALGREHAAVLRAAEDLPTPPTDPVVLRELAALLDTPTARIAADTHLVITPNAK